MVTVLNRTTLQYHPQDVNTPDYPTSQWIHNPDMSAVVGVPKERWIIAGDAVREMTPTEQDQYILASVRVAKIAAIDQKTTTMIAAGFQFGDPAKTFSLSANAQLKMLGSREFMDNPAYTYPKIWNTIDDLDTIIINNAVELDAFVLIGMGTVQDYLAADESLKAQVRAATTVVAINAVTDNR